jgi:hypothetical protein
MGGVLPVNADPHKERLDRALSPDIPNYYVNGFANALGTGDIVIALETNGKPVASVNMSYTVAKTLALGLSQIIATLETATGKTMLTTHEMEKALASGPSGITQ